MKKILLASLIFLIAMSAANAQVRFKASANKVVEVGENFRLDFSVNARGTGFQAPNFSNFRVLIGPSTSTSTSISMVNGKTTQSVNYSFAYILQATKEGKFTIGSAKVKVDGKVYKTQPITIEVLKGDLPQISQNNQAARGTGSRKSSGGKVFIRVNLSKTKVYQGEQIIASLKIYDKIAQLGGFNDFKFPSYSGFWAQEVKTPTNLSLTREKFNNQIYYSALLRQDVLFPQKSGTIIIEPCTVDCVVKEKVGQRRNFFGELVDAYQNVQKVVKSKPRKVTVLPLPDGKPASFTGAVGSNFKFKMSVDRTELKSNESVTLKLVVSGHGNIQMVNKLAVNFPASFDVFDPKVSNNINSSASGVRGSKTFEYLVIPREPGGYTIPATNFSYFDVKSKSYKTFTTQAINFKIGKGDKSAIVTTSGAAIGSEEVANKGTDIRHIFTQGFSLSKNKKPFFGSLWFYLSYLIALVVAVLSIFLIGTKIKRNKNIVLQKNKRANRISQKRLKEAAKFMKENNREAFYTELIKALWGFLSDKLNIPLSELSRDTVKETLEKQNIDEQLVNEFITTVDNCEFAKYAPQGGEKQIVDDYNKAQSIINKLIEVLG